MTSPTSRRTTTQRSSSKAGAAAIAKALAKKKAKHETRHQRRGNPGVPESKPARRGRGATAAPSRPVSTLMEPGRYLGDPWRMVGLKDAPREVDPSAAKFRATKRGAGKCTGNKLRDVTSAFTSSYYFAESARQEVAAIRRSNDAVLLWHASLEYEEASLAYWFGADYRPQQINKMLAKIERTLTEWTLAHCAGFRGLLPVWIRCKSRNGVGDGVPARHIAANTIALFPRYFNMSQNRRLVTMLHEMGHRSVGVLKPRDERHGLCDGGWNRKENMCYRDHGDVDNADRDFRFIGGNPRELAIAATNGDVGARKTALNNIDNYVAYMWNRHRDHQHNTLYMLPPGTKYVGRSPGETAAPSRG